MKDQEQKQKKKYKRKGQRKEVLFKDEEWKIVKANAAKMNLSTTRYIVKMSLSDNYAPQAISDVAELTRQLSKIGTNINQLARKANTINNIYSDDYLQMKQTFEALYHLLKQKISMLRRTAA